jgi:hypothetical protein
VVDPSLLRLAADRGVTICFADLDGADGLWVPEERTVLVNRSLSEREVAAVIEHELGHVAIDDQHADLDAGIGRPPPAASRRWAAALTAAACLAVVGGVTAGLARNPGGAVQEDPVVAPSVPPLTAAPPGPGEVFRTSVVSGPDGLPVTRTVTLTATQTATPTASSAGSVAPTATRATTQPAPQPSVTTSTTSTTQPTDTGSPPTEPPPTVDPTTESPAADTGAGLQDEIVGTGTVSVGPPAGP